MTNWAKLKVVDLKAELKRRGLPQHGLKNDLVARLTEADEELAQADADAPVDDPAAAPDAVVATIEEPVASSEAVGATVENETSTATDTANAAETASQTQPTEDAPVAPPSPKAFTAEQEHPKKEADAEADALAGQDRMEEDTEKNSATETAAPQEAASRTPTAESIQENLKRKRRSLSPPPSDEAIARKRARPEDATNGNIAPVVHLAEDDDRPKMEKAPDAMDVSEERNVEPPSDRSSETRAPKEAPPEPHGSQQEMDYERNAVPSVHPATSALYIKNFMRPLRPNDVEAHLVDLASPPGAPLDEDIITNFYLDQIRTHVFVVFKAVSAASRVRTVLHDTVWPNESNRKALWVDYVPPEKVEDWIKTEKSSGGGRSGARWEIVYEDGPDGTVQTHLESGTASTSKAGPPPGPSLSSVNAIPSGPRSQREPGPPTGPRAVRPGTGPGPRPPPIPPPGPVQRTRARPVIAYQVVSSDLARRRIDNMRYFYSPNTNRDFGREINRYSFENGDSFVDRGKEVFEGIRPPHRERERRRGGGGRRQGGRGFRPRSDRYLPGLPSGRDDRRPQRRDDDTSSRRDDGRDRDHRGRRR